MKTILVACTLALAFVSTAQAHRHHYYRHHFARRSHEVYRPSETASHGGVCREQTKAGTIHVSCTFASRFVGFINALVDEGHTKLDIGCASGGHQWNSKHHWGGACDIDQTSRNRTAGFMYHVSALAKQFDLTDGCSFTRDPRGPDCGHIEVPGPNGGGVRVARRRSSSRVARFEHIRHHYARRYHHHLASN